MNPLTLLKRTFEEDQRGFIYARQLQKLSRSNQLIQEIAHQYGYYAVYEPNSHHPKGYKHHTLIQNAKERR